MNETIVTGMVERVSASGEVAVAAAKEPRTKPMSGFEERLAARIAAMVAEKVVDGLIKASSGMHGLTLHQLPGLRLTGLRLSQFERFCKLMRENPGMVPFRAATQALEELKYAHELFRVGMR